MTTKAVPTPAFYVCFLYLLDVVKFCIVSQEIHLLNLNSQLIQSNPLPQSLSRQGSPRFYFGLNFRSYSSVFYVLSKHNLPLRIQPIVIRKAPRNPSQPFTTTLKICHQCLLPWSSLLCVNIFWIFLTWIPSL